MVKESDIGRLIRRLRNERFWTLQKLGDQSKVSLSHLGRIERGERRPFADILRKIAAALEIEEEELFREAGYLTKRGPKEGLGLDDLKEFAQAFAEFQNATTEFQRAANKFGGVLEKIAKSY